MKINKSSGIIFHPTSLPGKYGIGDFGLQSYEFVDMLSASGTKVWQVLPLGFTDNTEFSPYSSTSSLLGNPYIVALDNLNNELINKDELKTFSDLSNSEVEFKKVYTKKNDVFKNIRKIVNINEPEYQNFLKNDLIRKHITFITLNEVFDKNWNLWNKDYLHFDENLYEEIITKYKNIFAKHLFIQYEFKQQWQKLKSYANKKNVSILGDIPIYVNHNSADVWLNKELFDLDKEHKMEFVSGAVPDDFTTDGQIWNTTLYKWENHIEDDYKYWKEKLNSSLRNFDYLRIDHFIGLFKYWAIPFEQSALKGEWREGPWKTFFNNISNDVDFNKLLAEDLGVELQETSEILNKYDIPGMKVLQQRIPDRDNHDEIQPNNWKENVAAYTGTHDSPTIKQWFLETNKEQIEHFKIYNNESNYKFKSDVWNFISLTWQSPCKLAVTNVQDLLELGSEGRFNLPGTKENNWKWRIEDLSEIEKPLETLKQLNKDTDRFNT